MRLKLVQYTDPCTRSASGSAPHTLLAPAASALSFPLGFLFPLGFSDRLVDLDEILLDPPSSQLVLLWRRQLGLALDGAH